MADARLHRRRDHLEPGRGGARPGQRGRSVQARGARGVNAIYFTLPLIALSALPVIEINGELTTLLALPPEEGGYANDPVLGVVQNLGVEGALLDALEIYVGVLAATILFIATNAGVIGASRITYAMATYRQIPEVFRRLHPRFKTPWLSILLFAGVADRGDPAGRRRVRRHALLLRGDALVHDRARLARERASARPRGAALPARAQSVGAVDWPLFAVFGGIATGISFLVILVQNPATRWAGLGWLVLGLVLYAVYRRRVVGEPLTATVKAPPAYGPALALEYRRLLVPVLPGQASDEALDVAASLAAERGARITAVTVIEIRSTCRSAPSSRRGGGGEPRARRGAGDRRVVRRHGDPASRPRSQRRPGDRARGRAARRRGHRHRRAAQGSESRPASARSSGAPSTTCSRTRPAASW